jgi:cytidylate kinase
MDATGRLTPRRYTTADDEVPVDPVRDAAGSRDRHSAPSAGMSAPGGGAPSAVIALDGPSGTGKSTVARGVARALGYRYLDTGAMYRAATVAVLRRAPELTEVLELGAAPEGRERDRVVAVVAASRIEMGTDPDAPETRLDGCDVASAIRTPEVTRAVSAVSAVSEVRAQLVAQQRSIIGAGGIVVEGRDIASVVWPEAQVRVYLTASAAARAARRAGELGGQADVAAVQGELIRRDQHDSTRADSPLSVAPGVSTLDTSDLSVDQVIVRLVDMTRKRLTDG